MRQPLNQNGDLSGLQWITERPYLLLGGKVTYTGKSQCIWCEEFDNLDLCPGATNRDKCPEIQREIIVQSIEYNRFGTHQYTCNINHGELRLDSRNPNKIVIDKVEIPWENFKWLGTRPGA